jgi:pimeloyl-ACP methyl ester carboxylesterase
VQLTLLLCSRSAVLGAGLLGFALFLPSSAPLAGAPALRTVALDLGGRSTPVDILAPGRGDAPEAVILAHGFTRDRGTMTGHARRLAVQGVWAVVPDLPYRVDSRDNARALRDLVAALRKGAAGPRLERFVLVGFSAGGLAALLAADAPGVVGYIGLDPFDRPGGVGREAARRLRIPAYLLRGPSAACNAYSMAEPWGAALPLLVVDRQLPEASHCDFESPTDALCQFVCGRIEPQRQAVVQDFLSHAVGELLQAAPAGGAMR